MTARSRALPLAATALVVLALGTGCSAGPAVDASCDVDGVTKDVEHMLEEANLTADAIDGLQCSGDWAVAQVTVGGSDADPPQQTFVFQSTEFGWILKAPELACDTAAGLETIPDDLRDAACPQA